MTMNATTFAGSSVASVKVNCESGFAANSLTLDPVAALDAIEILVLSGTRVKELSLKILSYELHGANDENPVEI